MRELPLPDRTAVPNLTDYARACAEYAVSVPERFNPVVDIVESWAGDAPDQPALISLGPAGETISELTIGQLSAPGWSFRSMAKFCTFDQSALAAAAA